MNIDHRLALKSKKIGNLNPTVCKFLF